MEDLYTEEKELGTQGLLRANFELDCVSNVKNKRNFLLKLVFRYHNNFYCHLYDVSKCI